MKTASPQLCSAFNAPLLIGL